MADCESCKSKNQQAADVPYIAYEAALTKAEFSFKRLWAAIILLIVLLFGSNAGWIWYCNQWETVESWEITQENDGANNNFIGNDGDIFNGETDNK